MRRTALPRLLVFVAALTAGLLAVAPARVVFARQDPAGSPLPAPMSSFVRMISPVALASWITERGPDGTELLRALVILRGKPGWFLEPSDLGSSVQGWNDAPGHHRQVIVQGGRRFEITFDLSRRALTVAGVQISLGDRNVVLVDKVDASAPFNSSFPFLVEGAFVDQILSLGPRMPGSGAQIGQMLKDSEPILRFLRCDSTPPDARGRSMLERLCRETVGLLSPLPPEPAPDPALAPVADSTPARALAAAEARWAARKPAAYEFKLEVRCFCRVADTPVTLRVHDGTATYLTDLDDVQRGAYAKYDTIDKIFAELRRMAARPAAKLDARYDADRGYPRSVAAEISASMTDDFLDLTVTDFKPLTAPDRAPRPRQ
ncbi:MAG: DUF6174 domain-containing protein [Vicinamibacterales bacterium]